MAPIRVIDARKHRLSFWAAVRGLDWSSELHIALLPAVMLDVDFYDGKWPTGFFLEFQWLIAMFTIRYMQPHRVFPDDWEST